LEKRRESQWAGLSHLYLLDFHLWRWLCDKGRLMKLKEDIYHLGFLRAGNMPRRATWGSTRLDRRQRESGEILGPSLHVGFCGKHKVGQGK
jgi:hypothetical protein